MIFIVYSIVGHEKKIVGHAYLCSEIIFANINDYIIHNIIITVIVRSPQARCVECAGNAVTHYSNTHI